MRSGPIKVLLQTTIEPSSNDWDIRRFSLLRSYLESLTTEDGSPLCQVTARDRVPLGQPDSVLSRLDSSAFDEMWLFAVDVGNGLTELECSGITRFRERGGGLLVTRDHNDLGSSVCTLGGVGAAHFFHSRNCDPDPTRSCNDDPNNPDIQWPNYHSGWNGDYQEVRVAGSPHPLLSDPDSDDGLIHYLPAHPHEGGVGAPPNDRSARVIATGRSSITDRPFNLIVAFEPSSTAGPAIAESSFHHFVDYNWDLTKGKPTFVTDPPGNAMATFPQAMQQTKRYVRNLAVWLAGRPLSR